MAKTSYRRSCGEAYRFNAVDVSKKLEAARYKRLDIVHQVDKGDVEKRAH